MRVIELRQLQGQYPPGTGPGDTPEKIQAAVEKERKRVERGPLILLITLGIALLLLVVGSIITAGVSRMVIPLTLFLLGSGALVSGGLLGLLFGVPRAVIVEGETEGGATRHVGYTPNTNLEKVSDWLTAIVIGITLVQLDQIPGLFQRLTTFVAGSNAQYITNGMVVGTVVLFGVGGFLFGFLWSRIHLPIALYDADAAARARETVGGGKPSNTGDDDSGEDTGALQLPSKGR